jgi:hypothetical protein
MVDNTIPKPSFLFLFFCFLLFSPYSRNPIPSPLLRFILSLSPPTSPPPSHSRGKSTLNPFCSINSSSTIYNQTTGNTQHSQPGGGRGDQGITHATLIQYFVLMIQLEVALYALTLTLCQQDRVTPRTPGLYPVKEATAKVALY